MARDFKEFSLASEAPGEPVRFSSLLASPIQLPGNPSPGLMRLAQFGGGAVLAATSCLLSLPITERFLGVSSDQTIHISLAKQLYSTHQLPDPHFLYQALIILLVKIAPLSFETAGLIVLSFCYALTGVLLYREAARLLVTGGGTSADLLRGVLAAVVVAAAILVMQPVIRPGNSQIYRIGYFWSEPYYSPTYSLMKPLALISALSAVAFLKAKPGTVSRLAIVLSAFATVAGALAKPSFVICLLPALLILALILFFRRQAFDRRAVLFGLFVPAIAVVILQYWFSYATANSGVAYQDSIVFAPLKVMSFYSGHLASRFLLSILFPVAVYVLYWGRARYDTALNLGFLLFACGAGYSYFLAEKVHWSAGNFLWSGYISLFLLFVFSVLFYVGQIHKTDRHGFVLARHLLAFGILVLHVRSGILTEIAFLHTPLGHYLR